MYYCLHVLLTGLDMHRVFIRMTERCERLRSETLSMYPVGKLKGAGDIIFNSCLRLMRSS